MSTSNAAFTLQTIQTHLLQIDPTLRSRTQHPFTLPPALLALEKLNITLKEANAKLLRQSRALYQDLTQADLTTDAGKKRLADLQSNLERLDETNPLEGRSRKTFMSVNAGSEALELETTLNVSDHLLAPSDQRMVEDCSLGPNLRPGMYTLAFTYQEQTVQFAGAFVLTRQSAPAVDNLTSSDNTGSVLFFTPSRGLEAFASLHELDQNLRTALSTPEGHAEFARHLPVRYQGLDVDGIWPLELHPITQLPLFEHTWNAILEKRRLDVVQALSLTHDASQLIAALDKALADSMPDLTLRLDLRAQRLLELEVYNSLPDWYRSADTAQQSVLAQHISQYNQARQAFLDALGPAATPHALAHFQLVERLADELDIHDLDPNKLLVTTQRTVVNVGTYEQRHSLVELSLRGLHTGDEQPGSAFVKHTQLIYAGTPTDRLTPASVLTLLQGLQPRLEFANVQKAMLAEPQTRVMARAMLDQRLVTLAFIAKLQGHLNAADYSLFEQLRAGPQPHLRARTVSLHGAQLKDLWLLREEDADGKTKRLLLCTPESPAPQSFIAFSSERECQAHILRWADDTSATPGRAMSAYLMNQVPLRFRQKMAVFLRSLSFRPDANEHLEVTFGTSCSHTECLDAMVVHLLDGQMVDDYQHGTPPWYHAASMADRTRLVTLSDNAFGALSTYKPVRTQKPLLTVSKPFCMTRPGLASTRCWGGRKTMSTRTASLPTPRRPCWAPHRFRCPTRSCTGTATKTGSVFSTKNFPLPRPFAGLPESI